MRAGCCALVLVCSVLATVGASAQERAIASVEVECTLTRCQDEDEMRRLRSLTDLAAGKPYDDARGEAAAHYLMRTGFFAQVIVETRETPEGVAVTLRTIPQTYIREVHISSGSTLRSDIEQRMFLRSGSPYAGDESDLRDQREAIEALFVRGGYNEASVEIRVTDSGPYLVDLHVDVDRGERLDVERVFIKVEERDLNDPEQLTPFSYNQLRGLILDEFGFILTYSEEDFDAGQEEILEAYREAGHIRARVVDSEVVTRGEGVDLFVQIREGPHYTFDFEGNELYEDEELLERLSLFQTGFIDLAEVVSAADEIEDIYLVEGHYFAEVEASWEPLDEAEIRVSFDIDEGPVAEIREIIIEGNAAVSDQVLLDLMATREFGVLESAGYLQPALLEADMRNIETYYRELGFQWAHIYRWTLVAEDAGESLFITLFLNEGPLTVVDEVRFEGNRLFTAEQLYSDLTLRPGQPFGPAALDADRGSIQRRYNAVGYNPDLPDSLCVSEGERFDCTQFSLPSECVVYDPDRCTEARRGTRLLQECPRLVEQAECEVPFSESPRRVAISHRVSETELLTVGEVFVRGNFETDEDVILREFPLPEGAAYSRALELHGQSNIRGLDIFDSVRIERIGIDEEEDVRRGYPRSRVGIVIIVEERTNETIEGSIGLASQNTADNEFRVLTDIEAVYTDANFLGQAAELRAGGSFEVDITNPERVADQEFIASAEIRYFDPRFYYYDLVDQAWELTGAIRGFYDLLTTPQNQRKVELEITLRREFENVEGLSLELGTSLEYVQTRQVPAEENFTDALIFRVSPAVILDRRDSVINPREGVRAELRLDLADEFLQDPAFSRLESEVSYYQPIGRYFVLVSHARIGFAMGSAFSLFTVPEDRNQPLEDDDSPSNDRLLLPDSERFRLGGVAGVRGYPDNGLGPSNGFGVPVFGDVVLNGSVEARFPIVPSADLFGAWFVDAGQLQADFIDLSFDAFRTSTGMGIRWLAFGLVPVVLDYGLALDRRVGESVGQLHFNVGYTF